MITVNWFDTAETTVHHKAVGKWEWDRYYEKLDEAWAMIASKQVVTHILIDFLESAELPAGTLLNAPRGFKNRPANVGMVIVIDSGRRIAYFFNMLLRINRRLVPRFADVRFVSTVEAAQDLLDEYQNQHKSSNNS